MPSYKYNSVLLIDDNALDNIINEKIIFNSNFAQDIFVKDSCQTAIDFLQSLIDNNKELPEVIFVDIRMPVKTGFDFLVEFEQLQNTQINKSKIVMLSSSLDPNDHKKINEFNNVSDFFGKPLTNEILSNI